MAYVAWSVVFGEQPTAAKWNILGTNDASFNDGTGIGDDAIIARHILAGIVSDAKLTYGKVYRRQGGSATDWGTGGSTGYDTDSEAVKIQVGTFVKSVGTEESVTFPVAFTYRPWCGVFMGSANGANGFVRYKTGLSSNTTLGGIQCFNNAGSAISGEQVFWIAIGV